MKPSALPLVRARPIPGDGALEKRTAGGAVLIRQDLDVREPRVIVDGDVDVLPARARRAPLAIAMHAVSRLVKSAQALDVEMQHVAGGGPLIALHGRRRLGGPPIQPQPPQPGTDRRARH
jgi:hypothetical protein